MSSDKDTELYVHVGLARAASSMLQDSVWPFFTGLSQGSFRCEETRAAIDALKSKIVHDDLHQEDLNLKDNTSNISQFMRGGKVNGFAALISHEGLSVPRTASGKSVAKSLMETLERPYRAILVLREQRQWLRSRFLQDVKSGTFPMHLGFYEWACGEFFEENTRIRPYNPAYRIQYEVMLKDYIDTIGLENILVVSQEELGTDPLCCIKQIENFIGLDWRGFPKDLISHKNNKQINNKELLMLEIGGIIFGSKTNFLKFYRRLPPRLRNLGKGWARNGARIKLTDEGLVFDALADRISKTNRALEEIYGLNIRNLGYHF